MIAEETMANMTTVRENVGATFKWFLGEVTSHLSLIYNIGKQWGMTRTTHTYN